MFNGTKNEQNTPRYKANRSWIFPNLSHISRLKTAKAVHCEANVIKPKAIEGINQITIWKGTKNELGNYFLAKQEYKKGNSEVPMLNPSLHNSSITTDLKDSH